MGQIKFMTITIDELEEYQQQHAENMSTQQVESARELINKFYSYLSERSEYAKLLAFINKKNLLPEKLRYLDYLSRLSDPQFELFNALIEKPNHTDDEKALRALIEDPSQLTLLIGAERTCQSYLNATESQKSALLAKLIAASNILKNNPTFYPPRVTIDKILEDNDYFTLVSNIKDDRQEQEKFLEELSQSPDVRKFYYHLRSVHPYEAKQLRPDNITDLEDLVCQYLLHKDSEQGERHLRHLIRIKYFFEILNTQEQFFDYRGKINKKQLLDQHDLVDSFVTNPSAATLDAILEAAAIYTETDEFISTRAAALLAINNGFGSAIIGQRFYLARYSDKENDGKLEKDITRGLHLWWDSLSEYFAEIEQGEKRNFRDKLAPLGLGRDRDVASNITQRFHEQFPARNQDLQEHMAHCFNQGLRQPAETLVQYFAPHWMKENSSCILMNGLKNTAPPAGLYIDRDGKVESRCFSQQIALKKIGEGNNCGNESGEKAEVRVIETNTQIESRLKLDELGYYFDSVRIQGEYKHIYHDLLLNHDGHCLTELFAESEEARNLYEATRKYYHQQKRPVAEAALKVIDQIFSSPELVRFKSTITANTLTENPTCIDEIANATDIKKKSQLLSKLITPKRPNAEPSYKQQPQSTPSNPYKDLVNQYLPALEQLRIHPERIHARTNRRLTRAQEIPLARDQNEFLLLAFLTLDENNSDIAYQRLRCGNRLFVKFYNQLAKDRATVCNLSLLPPDKLSDYASIVQNFTMRTDSTFRTHCLAVLNNPDTEYKKVMLKVHLCFMDDMYDTDNFNQKKFFTLVNFVDRIFSSSRDNLKSTQLIAMSAENLKLALPIMASALEEKDDQKFNTYCQQIFSAKCLPIYQILHEKKISFSNDTVEKLALDVFARFFDEFINASSDTTTPPKQTQKKLEANLRLLEILPQEGNLSLETPEMRGFYRQAFAGPLTNDKFTHQLLSLITTGHDKKTAAENETAVLKCGNDGKLLRQFYLTALKNGANLEPLECFKPSRLIEYPYLMQDYIKGDKSCFETLQSSRFPSYFNNIRTPLKQFSFPLIFLFAVIRFFYYPYHQWKMNAIIMQSSPKALKQPSATRLLSSDNNKPDSSPREDSERCNEAASNGGHGQQTSSPQLFHRRIPSVRLGLDTVVEGEPLSSPRKTSCS